jgi:hypothetical protein
MNRAGLKKPYLVFFPPNLSYKSAPQQGAALLVNLPLTFRLENIRANTG